MKKVSIIFAYIGVGVSAFNVLSSFISIIMNFVSLQEIPDYAQGPIFGSIFFDIFLIALSGVGIWFGLFFAGKMKNAYSRDSIQTLAIVAIIFYGFLPGLFALLSKDDEYPAYYKKKKAQMQAHQNNTQTFAQTTQPQNFQQNTNTTNAKPIAEQLLEMKKLFDDGILTEEEYQEKRKELVSKL